MEFLIPFGIFNLIHKINNNYLNNSMSNNFTAFIHAFLTVLETGNYIINDYYHNINELDKLYYFIKTISTGYFLYDIFFILRNKKLTKLNIFYLYHHSASIYFINQDHYIYRLGYFLFWAELSNLPMYFVYYYLKTENKIKLYIWKKIQVFVYGSIRIPVISYILFITIKDIENFKPVFAMLPIYFIAMYCTYNMFKKLK